MRMTSKFWELCSIISEPVINLSLGGIVGGSWISSPSPSESSQRLVSGYTGKARMIISFPKGTKARWNLEERLPEIKDANQILSNDSARKRFSDLERERIKIDS